MLFSVQTPAAGGTAFAQFAAAWCYDGNGYILNDTGTSLDVRIGASGSVQTLAASALLPIKLVFSMAELYVRRTDQSTTQVTVEAQVGTGSAGGGTSAEVGVIAAATAAAAVAGLQSFLGLAPGVTFGFLGDSITAAGAGSWPSVFAADRVVSTLGTFHNFAVGGYTLANVASDYTGNVGGQRALRPALTGSVGHIYLLVGANDIVGASQSSVAAWVVAYDALIASLKADGWVVHAFTVLPRHGVGSGADGYTNTAQVAINQHVEQADWDFLIQTDRLFPSADDRRWFGTDGTHPTALAKKRLGQQVALGYTSGGLQLTFPPLVDASLVIYDEFSGTGNLGGSSPDQINTLSAQWVKVDGVRDSIRTSGVLVADAEGSADLIDSLTAPTSVEAVIATTSNWNLIFRATGWQNLWSVQYRSGRIYIRKRTSGADADIVDAAFTIHSSDVIKVTLAGSVISVLVNGVQALTTTDAYLATATLSGFHAFGDQLLSFKVRI